jgi:hypothetical protein
MNQRVIHDVTRTVGDVSSYWHGWDGTPTGWDDG